MPSSHESHQPFPEVDHFCQATDSIAASVRLMWYASTCRNVGKFPAVCAFLYLPALSGGRITHFCVQTTLQSNKLPVTAISLASITTVMPTAADSDCTYGSVAGSCICEQLASAHTVICNAQDADAQCSAHCSGCTVADKCQAFIDSSLMTSPCMPLGYARLAVSGKPLDETDKSCFCIHRKLHLLTPACLCHLNVQHVAAAETEAPSTLSTGAIIGIVIGVGAFGLGVGFMFLWYCWLRTRCCNGGGSKETNAEVAKKPMTPMAALPFWLKGKNAQVPLCLAGGCFGCFASLPGRSALQ